MAVAAYASLVSLTHVLDNVHYRAELRHLHVNINIIESFQGSVNFLLEFVEVHSRKESKRIDGLWKQISMVAFEAEEIFDLHVVNQIQLRSEGVKSDLGSSAFNEDIERLIQKIVSIKEELLVEEPLMQEVQSGKQPKVSEHGGTSMATSEDMLTGRQPINSLSREASLATPALSKNTIVGLDKHVEAIVDLLTRDEPALQIIPIVGMGGIGKTTLAKAVFDSQCTVDHFDRCIWLTISQEYTVENILEGLLNDGKIKKRYASRDGLREALYKELFDRRYLIVLDDVWSDQAWNDLRMCFPNNNNRSRVMMTTRLQNVAGCLSHHNFYSMTFLDENESWNLFCRTIFGKEDFPNQELEEFARKIVKSCKGLPLEIIVIGGLLAKSDMSREYWMSVARNVSSYANFEDGEHCFKILSLSYNNLPIHLKPCFLFMSSYREDSVIHVNELILKWIASGYIRAVNEKSLEDIAMDYINDLSSRNLIVVHSIQKFGMIKLKCGIHDLLRDMCRKEFDKEQFIPSPKVQTMGLSSFLDILDKPACIICGCRYRTCNEYLIDFSKSILCDSCRVMYSYVTRARLVAIMSETSKNFLHPTRLPHVFVSTQARYASVLSPRWDISSNAHWQPMLSELHFLWNLQILKLHLYSMYSPVVFPNEIWEMTQLRHIEVNREGAILPDPQGFTILKRLQSLSDIWNFQCTKNVYDRIPDLKILKINYKFKYEASIGCSGKSLCNLIRLQNLRKLEIYQLPENISFPSSLKELYLNRSRCKIPWSGMSIIGSLPNLEILKLDRATEGSEWIPCKGEFLRLKILYILCGHLAQWRADNDNFPVLELLQLVCLRSLEEIPSGIGDIPTLRRIELDGCSKSAVDSAFEIWKEQQDMENEILEIVVDVGSEFISISDLMSRLREEDEGNDLQVDTSIMERGVVDLWKWDVHFNISLFAIGECCNGWKVFDEMSSGIYFGYSGFRYKNVATNLSIMWIELFGNNNKVLG
ncbi:late blight resistance protein R1-A-like [Andrographis paniculata]|uniref:late blight resistance protein R1-A-like n=1 Tax=Andrographis paniculata TaxID=175694 RepID=UPI0021E776ED|nr:late blight resistance protein R1-A-like [Andrographis paniculata]